MSSTPTTTPKDRNIQRLRDLMKCRRKLAQALVAEKQRVEKMSEDANMKLSSIASDTFGASGRKMIEELIKGAMEAKEMAELNATPMPSGLKYW